MRVLVVSMAGLCLAACSGPAETPASSAPAALDEPMDTTPSAPENTLDLPEFHKSTLVLTDVPEPTGPAVSLFNGENLDEWDGWLGYEDPGTTYEFHTDQPMGPGGMGTTFSVVEEDGEPALFIMGEDWGSLMHRQDFGDYHLRLEYKWGETRYPPREDLPHNNGLLYHSHGEPGAVFGTWARSAEFEIMYGSTGMFVRVGDELEGRTNAGFDAAILSPYVRYMPDGEEITVTGSIWNAENHTDEENPVGEWNVVDLYVLGDRAVHVLNGVPVMELWDLCDVIEEGGPCVPLTSGKIQLQSEGADAWFRNITLEPIDSLPAIEIR